MQVFCPKLVNKIMEHRKYFDDLSVETIYQAKQAVLNMYPNACNIDAYMYCGGYIDFKIPYEDELTEDKVQKLTDLEEFIKYHPELSPVDGICFSKKEPVAFRNTWKLQDVHYCRKDVPEGATVYPDWICYHTSWNNQELGKINVTRYFFNKVTGYRKVLEKHE